MARIPLTRGQFAIVGDEDYENLVKYNWHTTNKGYACRVDKNRKSVLMHRQIMDVSSSGRKVVVDHIDHDPLNNQRTNLRICDMAKNQFNKRKTDTVKFTSIYKGVSWDKQYKKWRVSIKIANSSKYVGRYTDEKGAAVGYNKAALTFFGDYAVLNVV